MRVMASIVIPTINRPALLRKCLQALFKQTVVHSCYEIIVVTDGPDVATLDMASALKRAKGPLPRLRIVSLPGHRGPAAARNTGWRMARGRLVIFTDDDCIPSPRFVDAYLKRFRFHTNQPVAFTGKVLVPVSKVPTDYEKNIAQLEKASFITANCAISMEALEQTGGFDEDFTMAWREDSAMEFCLMKHGIPIHFVFDAVVRHPVRKAPWGVSLRSEKKNIFNVLLYKKYTVMYKRSIQARPPLLYYAILFSILGMLVAGLFSPLLLFACLISWAFFTSLLVYKRLQGTSHEPSHVVEIILTSMAIPLLSIFWNTYGCIRYKCLLI
jgi:GT2 family glycosyltransferase